MLQGYSVPLSPLGQASLTPPPPWHYSGDVLAVAFTTDPGAVAAVLPRGLSPDPQAPGQALALFIDWQFTAQNEEYLDPARYQYREAFVLVNAQYKDMAVSWCPYIYVDNDAALARGWAQGFPKKLGSVFQTRSFAAPSLANAPLASGGRFGASLSVHGERLMNARVTLRDPVSDPAKIPSRPVAIRRYFPGLEKERQNRPAVDELTLSITDDPKIAAAWTGDAELTMPIAAGEELHALAPVHVGPGFRYSLSYSVTDLRTLEDLTR